ncbi:DUF6741 domain-containing protein [Abortiporus biennis]
MAYPAYDSYHNSVSFPRQYSQYSAVLPGDYPYNDALTVGPYGESYPQPSYSTYAPHRSMSHYDAYEDYDYDYDPGYATSSTPYLSRRHSTMSHYGSRPRLDSYRRYSTTLIKFKRKGGFRAGISLGEAMSNVRLSGNDAYTFHDLAIDHRGRMILKIRWSGYTSMTYEIPVDGYEGRVSLQTLARRIARACVHFLQANMVPVSWDRVILYHLEEHSPGVWQPVFATS